MLTAGPVGQRCARQIALCWQPRWESLGRRSCLGRCLRCFSSNPPHLLFLPLCAVPPGPGGLTRCASSSAPECPACCTARTWWPGGRALPGVLVPCLRASSRTALVGGLDSFPPALGPLPLLFGGKRWHQLGSSPF